MVSVYLLSSSDDLVFFRVAELFTLSPLQESLSENAHVAYLPMSERLKHLGVHLATWVFSTVLALGCGAAVYFLCQFDREVRRLKTKAKLYRMML